MNADLGTLSDTDGTAGPTDTITVNATDSFGNVATQHDRGHGERAAGDHGAGAETIGVGKAALIPGGSLTESGNTDAARPSRRR